MDSAEQARSIKYYETPHVKEHNLDASGALNSNSQRGSFLNHTAGSDKKPKNVKDHVGNVDEKLDRLKEDSIEMKRNLEIARCEFERINLTTEKTLDEFVNQMMAGVETKMRDLHENIEDQKDENAKMQAQITEMRREHSEMQQRIIMGNKKSTHLTNSIGKYEQD